ncbi:aroma-sacti cluster domain-containing protein [Nonomuraea sp. NPDC049480]|uniref:aroma-sacti cluster domain-containing protein n=1 Tax=Nonomuraea sp. NPDC049480 TaxID=3364353 RepID=UPI0037B7CB0D
MASLEQLEAAGFDVTNATDEQRAVLEALTDEELQVLVSVRDRLEEAADVEGHAYPSGGWCW